MVENIVNILSFVQSVLMLTNLTQLLLFCSKVLNKLKILNFSTIINCGDKAEIN